MNSILAGAAWAVVGAGAGAAIRVLSSRFAVAEELEAGHGTFETAGPVLFGAFVFGAFGVAFRADVGALTIHSLFAAALIQVIFFDLEHGLILDRVTYPIAAFALVVSLFQEPWWAGISTGLAAGGIFLVFGAVGSLLAKTEALGLGDVKLATCIGLFLGPLHTLEAMIIAFGAAGAAAVGLAVWRRSLAGRIALGPYLAAGALIAMYPWS